MSRKDFLLQFSKVCDRFPTNASIIVTCGSQNVLTFAALSKLSETISNSILKKIPQTYPNTFIALQTDKRPCIVPIILAVWKAGLAIAPVVDVNATHLKLKSKYLLTDCKSFDTELYSVVDTIAVDKAEYSLLLNNNETDLTDAQWDMCYCLNTSGSTGQPKTVYVPWSCIYPNVLDLHNIFQITSKDILKSVTPFTFDPFFVDVFLSLISGAALLYENLSEPELNVLSCLNHSLSQTPGMKSEQNNELWQQSLECRRVTFLQVTPSIFRRFYDAKELLGENSSLKTLVLGGEKFPIINVKSTNCRIFNIYGVTELSCWAFINEVKELTKEVSLGIPLKDITYLIEDNELLIGSPRRCIINNESPKSLPDVVYRRTGDIVNASIDTNEIFYVTRNNNIAKKYGVKIDLEKINRALANCGIVDESEIIFEENLQVVAWFIVCHESNIDQNYKQLSIVECTEIYKKINYQLMDIEKPDCIIELKAMPLSLHGKRDMIALYQLVGNLFHKRRHKKDDDMFIKVWCDVLGKEAVSPDKTFIEHGGNSVLAVNLISQLLGLGIKVPSCLLPLLLSNGTFQKCLSLISVNVPATSVNKKRRTGTDKTNSCVALTLLWTFELKKCVDATPTIVRIQGSWCIVIGSHSANLSAVLAENGKELWTTVLGDRIEAGVCPSSDETILCVGCYDHYIYGIESTTGVILWKSRTGGMVKCTGQLSIDGSAIFVGSYDKRLYCLSVQNGSMVKSKQLSDGSLLGRPVISSEKLFVGTLDGSYFCLDATTFNLQWNGKLVSPIFSSPCLLTKNKKILFAEVKGTIHCFDVASGNKVWEFICGGNIFSGMTPVEGEKYVTFGCHDCHLYLIRTEPTNQLVWKRQLDSPIYGTPTLGDTHIVCSSTKGFIYLITITGEIEAKLQMGGEVFSSPVFWNNRIYIGCRNNQLACIGVK